ncbi:MAG: membrane lipoprotein lipid attachment site-containing protein [Bacteroidales bacterium]|nr:membrane lipoprotein lipid attachment site-containing protein [Bacteroidales bacterium]
MKKLLFALSLMILLSACKWTGGTRGNNAEALPPQDPQDELQAAVSAMEEFFGKLADAVDDAIETGNLDTTGFNQPNVTVTHEEVQDDIQEPDAWYSKDFSFKVIKHVYITANVTKSEGDATYIVTRIGNKAWIQQTVLGRVQYTDVYEYSDRCTTKQRFKNGRAVSTSPYKETSLGQCLAYQLVSGKEIPIAKQRSAATVQKTTDGTICDRPCRIIEEKVDEMAGGSRITFYRTAYVDKEYGFIYKMHSKGDTSAGKVDTTPYEVLSFTDKPTAKDIPDYK